MRREREALEKVTINLFKNDMNRLQCLHEKEGAAKAIRELIRRHIEQAYAARRSELSNV